MLRIVLNSLRMTAKYCKFVQTIIMNNPTTPGNASQSGPFEMKVVGGGSLKVRPKTKQELAGEYGMHPQTIGKWCRAIQINGRKNLSISQLLAFYKHYGLPADYDVKVHFE
jgi:hypothetical protein